MSLTIEDLGSANGTRIRRSKSADATAEVTELRVEQGAPMPLALDEPVVLGSVTMLVRSEAAAVSVRAKESRVALPDGIVSEAAETKRVFELAERLAKGPLNVLLTGETGVGKEVLAAFIHRRSPRAAGPLVEVNCAAFTESLAESELFGHQKGAFTGAIGSKEGFFEAADGGTLFLDEVGELTASHPGEAPPRARDEEGGSRRGPRCRSRSTCASSRPRIGICRWTSSAARSGRISTSASTA